jgi:hypothetical protein
MADVIENTIQAEKRFNSRLPAEVNKLIPLLREGQGFIIGMLTNRWIELEEALDTQQKAILAVAASAFNQSRSAEILITRGYSIPAMILVRAFYERLATALHFRANSDAAEAWMVNHDKNSIPKFATVTKQEFEGLVDAYTQWRFKQDAPGLDREEIKRNLKVLYGLLSNLAHPKDDASAWQFAEDAATGHVWFAFGPNERAVVHGILALVMLCVLQVMMNMVLALELKDAGRIPWDGMAAMWEASLDKYSSVATEVLAGINADSMDEWWHYPERSGSTGVAAGEQLPPS